MDESVNVTNQGPAQSAQVEDSVLTEILAAFRKLPQTSRERMLSTVATFLEIGLRPNANIPSGTIGRPATTRTLETHFSEDRSISPKDFMFEKQPKTDVERVACLAYYLTHYRDTPHFKTLDISTLNTEAAQVKFSNAAVAVDNATKQNYLVAASKGTKQLSALGERFVLALPDREKARSIMANARPRRRMRKADDDQADIEK
jgi:hypothetical protein